MVEPHGKKDEVGESRIPPLDYSPKPQDVCCGRGKMHWNHAGNSNYRKRISSNVVAYQSAEGKPLKTNIARDIVDSIHRSGGRFIKRDPQQPQNWKDIGYEASLNKVDHSLRDQAAPQEPEEPLSDPQVLPDDYRPSSMDVYCGRGKKNWHHEGNSNFRILIRSNVKTYQDAKDKNRKNAIVVSIVNTIHSHGGRFVKHNASGKWYDIGESQARYKVHHSLRDHVYIQTKMTQQNSSSSSMDSAGSADRVAKRPSEEMMVSSDSEQESQQSKKQQEISPAPTSSAYSKSNPSCARPRYYSLDSQNVPQAVHSQLRYIPAFSGLNFSDSKVAYTAGSEDAKNESLSSSLPNMNTMKDELLLPARRGELESPLEGHHIKHDFFSASSSVSTESPHAPQGTSSNSTNNSRFCYGGESQYQDAKEQSELQQHRQHS